MMLSENTAERKCQKEKLIELHRSACASLTKREFLSIQVLSEPLKGAHGSHLAWLQSLEIPPQGAPARSHCHLHLYLASGHSWTSIFLLSAFSAELPSLNQNTVWVQGLKDKKATSSWQVFAWEARVGSYREIAHFKNETIILTCAWRWCMEQVCHSWRLFIPTFSYRSTVLWKYCWILWILVTACHMPLHKSTEQNIDGTGRDTFH